MFSLDLPISELDILTRELKVIQRQLDCIKNNYAIVNKPNTNKLLIDFADQVTIYIHSEDKMSIFKKIVETYDLEYTVSNFKSDNELMYCYETYRNGVKIYMYCRGGELHGED